jgi:hypothetical protein
MPVCLSVQYTVITRGGHWAVQHGNTGLTGMYSVHCSHGGEKIPYSFSRDKIKKFMSPYIKLCRKT